MWSRMSRIADCTVLLQLVCVGCVFGHVMVLYSSYDSSLFLGIVCLGSSNGSTELISLEEGMGGGSSVRVCHSAQMLLQCCCGCVCISTEMV